MASSPLHFLTGGEGHRHLQEGKQRTIQSSQVFLFFQIFAPLPSLLDLPFLVFICGGGAEGGRRCCTRSGPSLLIEEGGQLWRMRKGRHLWTCCWRRAVAGGRFVDDTDG
jgi:hypothetical protein